MSNMKEWPMPKIWIRTSEYFCLKSAQFYFADRKFSEDKKMIFVKKSSSSNFPNTISCFSSRTIKKLQKKNTHNDNKSSILSPIAVKAIDLQVLHVVDFLEPFHVVFDQVVARNVFRPVGLKHITQLYQAILWNFHKLIVHLFMMMAVHSWHFLLLFLPQGLKQLTLLFRSACFYWLDFFLFGMSCCPIVVARRPIIDWVLNGRA